MERHIHLPITKEEAATLKAGEAVLLSGVVYTARDAAHKRMAEALDAGEELPFTLEGNGIYYMGPSPARPGRPIGSAGPTTSGRMDPYTPRLLDLGLGGMIGKGARSDEVRDAIVRNGAVYFVTVGGAAAYLAKCVTSSETLAYDDLGTEALRRVEVVDFPVFVGVDTRGNDLYDLARA